MAGEVKLDVMLSSLSPELLAGEYVFSTVDNARYGEFAETDPFASITEKEGLTLVLKKSAAENAGLSYQGVFRCITLGVHSSLQAVGLTAAITGVLAENGISANVIAGHFHDHIFVQAEFADGALGILLGLSELPNC